MTKANQCAHELRSLCDQALEQFNAGNYDGVAEFYATETQFLAPDFNRITTREGVRKFWKNTFNVGYRFEKVETIEIRSGGEMAYWLFDWIMTNPDGNGCLVIQTGKNVIIWEKTSTTWKIRLDCWNSPS